MRRILQGKEVTHYYNEFHAGAADWLEELIRLGAIPAGFVDRRSIEDVTPEDLTGTTQAHFFAGIGGWAEALRIAGHASTPNIWTGSPPCQPWSVGGKKLGFEDPRHLAPQFLDLVGKCRPRWLFGEQVSRALRLGWVKFVQDTMHAHGYIAAFAVLPAGGFGAPHRRERIYFGAYDVANADGNNDQREIRRSRRTPPPARRAGKDVASGFTLGTGNAYDLGYTGSAGWERRLQGRQGAEREDQQRHAGCSGAIEYTDPLRGFWRGADWVLCRDGGIRPVESGVVPLVDGFSPDLGSGGSAGAPSQGFNILNTAEAAANRLRGYGNAIVPQAAAAFVLDFMEAVNDVI